MSEHTHESDRQDEILRQWLAAAVGPPTLSDAQVEQLLDVAEEEELEFDEDRLERMMDAARSGEAAGRRSWVTWIPERTPADTTSCSEQRRELSMRATQPPDSPREAPRGSAAAVVVAALTLLAVLLVSSRGPEGPGELAESAGLGLDVLADTEELLAMTPHALPEPLAVERAQVGQTIRTAERQRRRLILPDSSVLFVNEKTEVQIEALRRLKVPAGEVFVEVAQQQTDDREPVLFTIHTPDRELVALGTRFGVDAGDDGTDVVVTQGKVRVSGLNDVLVAGQKFTTASDDAVTPARRASEELDWTRDLMVAATGPIVPPSVHAGGTLSVDPQGQETRLSLRKYHVDVHIEDGFARTTIDQTYFNHTRQRLEGTFRFPLPPDASLSRLAMYVNGRLMEAGMQERSRARDVYEEIRYARRDPALLEWVDGSTFKMRVFPLEARQEKRLVISYTQRLNPAYGTVRYRFPAGHNLNLVRDWSTRLHVKRGGELEWKSPSHELTSTQKDGDLTLEAAARNVAMDRDLVVEIEDEWGAPAEPAAAATERKDFDVLARRQTAGVARFAQTEHDEHKYLMLRLRPQLDGDLRRPQRNWVFLFEASGDRDPLLARVQIEVIRTLLKNVEHSDTFAVVTGGTRAHRLAEKPLACTVDNIERAISFLEQAHLIGALDFSNTVEACRPFFESPGETHLVHVGSGVPVLGETDEKKLVETVPREVRYVGVGVGRRWSRQFMRAAAARTGGYVTQINPDEKVTWRAFELLSVLNAPRLLDVTVVDSDERLRFLTCAQSVAQGEEICAMCRFPADQPLPESVVVSGTVGNGQWTRTVPVVDVAERADYLPRSWARLEIERLLGDGAAANRDAVIALSKAMYVMSPFTSLLVLENEEEYARWRVEQGREDHWARYASPEEIPVVQVPQFKQSTDSGVESAPESKLRSILVRDEPLFFRYTRPLATAQQYGEARYKGLFREAIPETHLWLAPDEKFNSVEAVEDRRRQLNLLGADVAHRALSDYYYESFRQLRSMEKIRARGRGAVPEPAAAPQTAAASRLADVIAHDVVSEEEARARAAADQQVRVVPLRTRSPEQVLDQLKLLLSEAKEDDSRDKEVDSRDEGRISELKAVREALVEAEGLLGQNRVDRFARQQLKGFAGQTVPLGWGMPVDGRGWGYRGRFDDEFSVQDGLQVPDVGLIVASDGEVSQVPLMRMYGTVELQQGQSLGEAVNFGVVSRGLQPNAFDYGFRVVPRYSMEFTEEAEDEPVTVGGFVRHRWSMEAGKPAAAVGGRVLAKLKADRSRPVFGTDRRLFGDLVAHAPGLNTSVDDLFAAWAEDHPAEPAAGRVDAAARKLIERARPAGWESIRIDRADGQPPITLSYDGNGRFVRQGTVSDGLSEHVVCDGTTLWHMYKDIGLAARREATDFHKSRLRTSIPWLLPPADELAVGNDVTALDDRTVSITPLAAEDGDEQTEDDAGLEARLIFGRAGRLTEQRLVTRDTGTVVGRVKFEKSGRVSVFDGDNELAFRRDLHRTAGETPDLTPDIAGYVVLPLPYRSPASVLARNEKLAKAETTFADLPEEEALRLLAADTVAGNADRAVRVVQQRFVEQGDARPGFSVLLASRFPDRIVGDDYDLRPDVEASPLAQFVRQYVDWIRSDDDSREFAVEGDQEQFVARLATARNLFLRWRSGAATRDRTRAQIAAELDRVLDFIGTCGAPEIGWTILSAVQPHVKQPELLERVADAAARFERSPQLAWFVRHERIRALFAAGRPRRAQKLFEELLLTTFRGGVVPAIDPELREAFRSGDDGVNRWNRLLAQAGSQLLEERRLRTAFLLSLQLRELGDESAADHLFDQVLAALEPRQEPDLALLAIEQFRQADAPARAEQLLSPVLGLPAAAESAALWRYASRLADESGRRQLALTRLERALEIEYEHRPDVINLQQVRADYTDLLSRYEQIVDASTTLETPPPPTLSRRVVAAADRWRTLDREPEPCRTAARVIAKLGDRELAWDYVTTPLALQPGEAGSWQSLAGTLAEQKQIDLAGLAWERAYAVEQTNPEILLRHARMLIENDREREGFEIARRIVDKKWQPRFEAVVKQARELLNSSK